MNPYAAPAIVIEAPLADRATFIRRTYAHLAGAIALFALLCTIIITSPLGMMLASMMTGKIAWIVVLAAFMGVSWLAQTWAQSETSQGKQYAGLILYTVFEAIIFTPILLVAKAVAGGSSDIILKAGFATGGLVLGLTIIALTTKKDFSFMDGFLKVAGFVALGLIVASMIFGFSLGTWFSGAMILFAGGSLLRNTSNLLYAYNTRQHVAASLSLFADVALMFWYVLRLLIQLAASND